MSDKERKAGPFSTWREARAAADAMNKKFEVFPETENDETRLTLMQGMVQDFPWVRAKLIAWLEDLYPDEMK